jgi:ABC-type multidrug transport system ATPase subunit
LDILAGRKNTGVIEGEICVNGEPRNKSFKRLAGYVTQDDVFMGTLTVREHLRYVAMLRLPAHMQIQQKMDRVDDCLRELGIYHIANSRIGTDTARGISGGERKRLAIASELVVDPSILLLDEPTSGLDSYSASSLIQTLQNLAHGKKNRTVIMSIHQPRSDIFYMFDNLMVFSHGRAVYFGEAAAACTHFASIGYVCPQNFNPADFIIDTVSNPQFITTLKEVPKQADPINYYTKTNANSPNLNEVDEYAAPFLTQFNVLTRRTFLHALRNPFLLRVQYILFTVVALLLGYLYHGLSNDLEHGGFQNRMGSLFFIVTLLSFGAITSIDLFFSERLLFLRERATGCYRTSAYFLSKAVSDLIPMRILPPLLLGCIVYWMVGYQPDPFKFGIFLFTLVMISMTSSSMCFVISSISPSVAVGNLIAILLLFFFLIFGGFLVNISNMPSTVRWITNLSYMTFGYSILLVNEFDGITININPQGLDTNTPIAGSVLLLQVGMNVNHMQFYTIGLCVMLVFYMLAAYLALRFAVKEKR